MERKVLNIGLVILLMLTSVVFISCGKAVEEPSLTPSESLINFYMAANEGEYSEAEKYSCSKTLNQIKNNPALAAIGGI